jgi:acyl-CoA synthetase (AMP-forming)/AMP-acid ligase II
MNSATTSTEQAPAPTMSIATAWEAIADELGDADALIHGDVVRSWGDFDDLASRVAGHLTAAGLQPDSKVAFYLYNGTEYLEATFGAFKARCVPVNVNYRYLESELHYLLENSDAEAVIVSAELVDRLTAVLGDLPLVKTVLVVGASDEHPVPDIDLPGGVLSYDEAVRAAEPMPRIDRSPEDLWFLYTGGTTGMPKGVMWPHRSLMGAAAPTFRVIKSPVPSTPEGFAEAARRFHDSGKAIRLLAAAPLMHDGHELCRTVQDRAITQLTIVGDAFAKPMLQALEEADARGTPYDLSTLRMVLSSGVIWSQPVKDRMVRWTDAILADLLGSSEGTGFGTSVTKKGASAGTASFRLGEHAKVFTEAGEEVQPGSGTVGVLAVGGPIPIGYYKDPEKTAATFREFGGRIWSVPGDFATVEADGTIRLLGRGSVCINTAGEKVYPEEVEEALKLHPAVRDANVVGLPDEKWGQSVTGVIELEEGVERSDQLLDEIIVSTKSHLAGYKCPKRLVVVDRIRRGPNGKADYKWATATAEEAFVR